jgi:hypothetical protein
VCIVLVVVEIVVVVCLIVVDGVKIVVVLFNYFVVVVCVCVGFGFVFLVRKLTFSVVRIGIQTPENGVGVAGCQLKPVLSLRRDWPSTYPSGQDEQAVGFSHS